MSVIGGYQSDANLQNIDFVGDFPIENSLGGYGITTGTANSYSLVLTPPISQYRIGMHFIINFNFSNPQDAPRLNIDGNGFKLLKKAVNGQLENLDSRDLNNRQLYHVIYDGSYFQVATGLEPTLPAATTSQRGIAELATGDEVLQGTDNQRIVTPLTLQAKQDKYLNRETLLGIEGNQISPDLFMTAGRNRYVAVNGNLIIGKDIRIRSNQAIPTVFDTKHVLNLPKPLNTPTPRQPTMLLSTQGGFFLLEIDAKGQVFITGTFTNVNEELILNLTPYLAKVPLEYFEQSPT